MVGTAEKMLKGVKKYKMTGIGLEGARQRRQGPSSMAVLTVPVQP